MLQTTIMAWVKGRALSMVVACLLLAACAPSFCVDTDMLGTLSEDEIAIHQNIYDRATLLNKGRLRDTLPYFSDSATITATSTADRKHHFTKPEYKEFVLGFKERRYRDLRLVVKECRVIEVQVDGDEARATYSMEVRHRYGAQTLQHEERFRREAGRWLVVENSF